MLKSEQASTVDQLVYSGRVLGTDDTHPSLEAKLNLADAASRRGESPRWHQLHFDIFPQLLRALHADVLLRLRADDPSARCCLGNKYGAEPRDAAALLQAARTLGVNVIGIRHGASRDPVSSFANETFN